MKLQAQTGRKNDLGFGLAWRSVHRLMVEFRGSDLWLGDSVGFRDPGISQPQTFTIEAMFVDVGPQYRYKI